MTRLASVRLAGCFALSLVAAICTIDPHSTAWGQTTPGSPPGPPAAAPAPSPAASPTPVPPLTTPSMSGPLTLASPNEINIPKYVPALSELPKPISSLLDFDVNGIVSGLGMVGNHPQPGDYDLRLDASNALVWIQKPDGIVQYYLQVGGYGIPALGAPYVPLHQAVNSLYGVLPVAYLKIAPTSNFSIEGGNLPTLIGAEYTFTFENMQIERGLLWNQENAIVRGVQINYSQGPVSASVSWNNGFYSHSYTWVTGLLSYAINSANSLAFVGGGQTGFAASSNFATPLLLNNSQIYNLIYTYNSAPWIVQPYFQWTVVPHNHELGVLKTTSTLGGAVLASYSFTDNFFLTGRWEYIGNTGSPTDGSANLLYGQGSQAWSLTVTPTFQYKQLFARLEGSYVQAVNYVTGDTFGKLGDHPTQLRGALEFGVLF